MNELIDLTQTIVDGKEELLKGGYKLFLLAHLAGVMAERPFSDKSLDLICSDIEDLPILEDFRNKCNPDFLKEKQPVIDMLESKAKEDVLRNCHEVLQRFKKVDLEDLEIELMITQDEV